MRTFAAKEIKILCSSLSGIILLIVLFYMARRDYLLYHTVVESFSIIVSFLIYVFSVKSYRYSHNSYLLFLGYAYCFIAVLKFLHMATYQGMGIFSFDSPNTATQLWIAARLVEALSFLIAPLYLLREVPVRRLLVLYIIAVSSIVWMIMGSGIFPVCYVDGAGLTLFKKISESALSLLILGSVLHLYYRRADVEPLLFKRISLAMIISAVSAILFSFYIDIYGLINFLGHIGLIISSYIIFSCVTAYGFEHPFDTIFRELKASSITDPLTGLLNRQGFFETAGKEVQKANKAGETLEFLLIDIDNFKAVNDRYGHAAGDLVLRGFAHIIRERCSGISCRLGGDEFVVLIKQENSPAFRECVRDSMDRWRAADSTVRDIDLSIGRVAWSPGEDYNILKLLAGADAEMYKEKQSKKKSGRKDPAVDRINKEKY